MIELEGLEATYVKKDNVHFVKLQNADISFIIRKSNESFTTAAKSKNTTTKTEYSANLQFYEATTTMAKARLFRISKFFVQF